MKMWHKWNSWTLLSRILTGSIILENTFTLSYKVKYIIIIRPDHFTTSISLIKIKAFDYMEMY